MKKTLALLLLATALSACSGTLPVEYTAQSFGKLPGTRAQMGTFAYQPALDGKVEANQVQNTAIGQIMIGEDLANYVRRATALELEKSGTNVSNSSGSTVEANVIKILADDLGYSVRWSYTVQYTIKAAGGNAKFQKTYEAKERKTGKFSQPSDYTSTFNLLILDGIEQFMADVREHRLLR
jgi:uncharacterized lipoprotein YajG